jgi:hypothetical protein
LIGLLLKKIIRRLFFKKLDNQDFNQFIEYTISLLPNITITNIFILLLDLLKAKPSELFNFNPFKEVLIHTLPLNNRNEIIQEENTKIKYLFIIIILWDILKRFTILFKNIILFPFKIGVYSFIAFLFGVKVDYLLSFFDLFRFNLPG